MRKVIFHYHLFKNAGTSIDSIFRSLFASGISQEKEFPEGIKRNRACVKAWISEQKSCLYFSSHTAYLPPPRFLFTRVLPIIFVRHPLDRVASVYEFESRSAGSDFGSALARKTDFSGYLNARLAVPLDRQCRNFHAQKLAFMYGERHGPDIVRAEKAIRCLPFVGVVDRFAESLMVLQSWLKREGVIGADVVLEPQWKNATQSRKYELDQRLVSMEEGLAPSTFSRLLEANQDDLQVYQLANEKLDRALLGCS
ncbi:sulfotransferase family 2 domain-containing protein [Gilvimarinus sp. DA14]|uniref:sulfotransferase family 2 domain-containing protein n=1 Tax=Gilvimarinus sp. DA14 TaxID=2956798 RepID=UPI0020B79DF8|nr:sulfotransferase family 2 domain-containing protein [Gilvimarinus sp. DA14]UTF60038.1 sulfotransferase family 2 domain-containing protein [Gilvimarinus sp. DA14]